MFEGVGVENQFCSNIEALKIVFAFGVKCSKYVGVHDCDLQVPLKSRRSSLLTCSQRSPRSQPMPTSWLLQLWV